MKTQIAAANFSIVFQKAEDDILRLNKSVPRFQKLKYSLCNEPHPPSCPDAVQTRFGAMCADSTAEAKTRTLARLFDALELYLDRFQLLLLSSVVSCNLTANGETIQSPRENRAMQAFKAFSSAFHVPRVQCNTAKPRSWQAESDFLTEIKRGVTR